MPDEYDECRRCYGTGQIDVYPGGGFALNPGNRPSGVQTCPVCKGSGKRKREEFKSLEIAPELDQD